MVKAGFSSMAKNAASMPWIFENGLVAIANTMGAKNRKKYQSVVLCYLTHIMLLINN